MLRRLLDLLDRDALVALQEVRGLRGKSSNDDRRTGLSRSYRGDLEAFLGDLRREDLLTILVREFLVRGRRYTSGSLGSFSRDELQKMAYQLFVRGDVPAEFVELEESAFVVGDRDDELPDAADADDTPQDEADSDEASDEAADPDGDVGPTLAGPDWGRARKIPVLLRALGMDVPERLRAGRFRELLQRLAALGIEVQLQDGTPVADGDDSPGIYAKLRLRRRQSVLEPEGHVLSDADVVSGPPVEPFEVELSCWLGVGGARARVTCALVDGPPGLRIDNPVPGVSAMCRETQDLVLSFLGPEALTRLNSATVTLRLEHFPQVIDEVRASLGVALALVAVAQRRRPLPGLVVMGELSEAGEVVSQPPDLALMQALTSGDRTLVLPASSLDGADFSALPAEVDLLPVSRLADAVQLALQAAPAE